MLCIDFTDLMVFIYDCSRYGRRVYTRLSRAMGAKSRLYMFHVNLACDWPELVYTGKYTGEYSGEYAGGCTGEYIWEYTGEYTEKYAGSTLGSTLRVRWEYSGSTLRVRWGYTGT